MSLTSLSPSQRADIFVNNRAASRFLCVCLSGLVAVIVIMQPVVVAAQSISGVRVDSPRDFAYTIGDKIRREMSLTLKHPYRLDPASLPDPGRMNRWLEITEAVLSVEYEGQDALYQINVEYQIFNAPRKLTSVTIPQLEFVTKGGATDIPVFIPEWTFSIAPVVGNVQQIDLSLQPDRPVQPIPTATRTMRFSISLTLFASLLIYIAYRTWLLPRIRRQHYPFAVALQTLRKLQRTDAGPDQFKRGLREFHAAFNQSAGRVIFVENLQEFLSANSQYASLNAPLSELFTRSSDIFFNNFEVSDPAESMQDLTDLCRRCRILERTAA